jgi:6-phosphofructokinase 1
MIHKCARKSFAYIVCDHDSQLSQNAIHAAFSGFTGFSVGIVNNRYCLLPVHLLTKATKKVQSNDRCWQGLLASTGQPSFLNQEEEIVSSYE